MRGSIETSSEDRNDASFVPILDGEYSNVTTLGEHEPRVFTSKFGTVTLHSLSVELTREYDDKPPRTTEYEALAAYRTDLDSPDQTLYPLVEYSNALLTTPRKHGTATNRYFLNPAYEGFASVNVSAKHKVAKNCADKLRFLMPHTISLEEMADDEIVVTKHVAQSLGLGQPPDAEGVTHFNKSGYSRGVQVSIVQAARAGLHGVAIDRLHGRGPGPINKASIWATAKSIRKELRKEGIVIANQLLHDPLHAVNNYPNVVTHQMQELVSYIGDASALLRGDVARAMPHINPNLRGYVSVYNNDPFGRHKDYVAHFEEFVEEASENTHRSSIAPGLLLIRREGAHMSGMDQAEVKFDRLEWGTERDYLDGKSHTSHIAG